MVAYAFGHRHDDKLFLKSFDESELKFTYDLSEVCVVRSSYVRDVLLERYSFLYAFCVSENLCDCLDHKDPAEGFLPLCGILEPSMTCLSCDLYDTCYADCDVEW